MVGNWSNLFHEATVSGEKRIRRLAKPSGRNIRARARDQIAQVQAAIERSIDEGRIKPGERIAAERERYQRTLMAALKLLQESKAATEGE